MRKEIANQVFDTIQQAQERVCEALMKVADNLENVIKLTKYP
jgi:molecular chaperone GrpE (heat shock protein)